MSGWASPFFSNCLIRASFFSNALKLRLIHPIPKWAIRILNLDSERINADFYIGLIPQLLQYKVMAFATR